MNAYVHKKYYVILCFSEVNFPKTMPFPHEKRGVESVFNFRPFLLAKYVRAAQLSLLSLLLWSPGLALLFLLTPEKSKHQLFSLLKLQSTPQRTKTMQDHRLKIQTGNWNIQWLRVKKQIQEYWWKCMLYSTAVHFELLWSTNPSWKWCSHHHLNELDVPLGKFLALSSCCHL